MLFNSLYFLVFFLVVAPIAMALGRRVTARNWLLLVASYYFYACWDWRFLGLIWLSTVVDYGCGIALERRAQRQMVSGRRAILTVSLAVNLGILATFKYLGFLVESATEFLNGVGLSTDPYVLGIVLPVGISFYTFQTLSYTIDVYRGRLPAEKDPLTFALFVAFFPQLVAGPIERASRLLPQLNAPSAISWEQVRTGATLVAWGLVKKVVLADNLAPLVDQVYGGQSADGVSVLLGTYAFAIQIYCDFSGYSDIARGIARILGFDLMQNFDLPYLSGNPSEFWRRWHISLSTWLRDYLYVPLGGNRAGEARTYRNLALTMALGGLWHGAGWNFLVWGIYHGALLCAHRFWHSYRGTDRLSAAESGWSLARGVRVFGFFHLVCLGWLFFRADSMARVASMLSALLTDFAGTPALLDRGDLVMISVSATTLLGVQLFQLGRGRLELIPAFPAPVRAIAYVLLGLSFLLFGEFGGDAFIYFQF